MKPIRLAWLCGLALAGANAMACYTVYDRNDRVIYQGVEPPVDMSEPLHRTLGRSHPGAHMVFDATSACTPVRLAQVARPATSDVPAGTIRMERPARSRLPTSSAPLLTDVQTARANRLPYTQVAGNVALVPAQAAARVDLPTFTVIPSEPVMAGAPDTRTLGAGPARRPPTVITELRDGTTVLERGQTAVRMK